jgi:hypothetical protein
MRPVVFVVAILVSVAFAFSPAAASAKPPGSPQPQDVQRLFEQRGAARIYPERTVEVEQVAAVAASTEGLSASAALARVTGSGAPLAAAVATAVQCRVVDYSLHRGIFPYHRWVAGQTYWCFNYGGEITYRSSNTSARVDGVCSGSNARDWRVAGGAGYSWAIVHHEADFSCATPWWYSLNDTPWMEATFDSYGNAWVSRTA